MRRMIDQAHKPVHKGLIALCGMCGCRIGEAISVRPTDFNIADMILEIRGKGDKTRWVPISEEAWEYLSPLVVGAILNGDLNKPIVPLLDRYARGLITITAEHAGLSRRVSSHQLRATFATAVYDKCNDARLVQILLGHGSLKTTEIYIGRKMEQLREAVAV